MWALLTMRTSPSWSGSGTLYCDNYDDSETVAPDDGRRCPLRDRTTSWQRGHEALIDPSRAERIFDSITTRNPREPIGLIFSQFRDELAGRGDLSTPYEPPVRRGLTRMAGRYQEMSETGEGPLLESALSRLWLGQQLHDAVLEDESPGDGRLKLI